MDDNLNSQITYHFKTLKIKCFVNKKKNKVYKQYLKKQNMMIFKKQKNQIKNHYKQMKIRRKKKIIYYIQKKSKKQHYKIIIKIY